LNKNAFYGNIYLLATYETGYISEWRCFMGFIETLLWNAGLFLFLIAVATAGVFAGKKLRDRKEKKEK
jgi:hypothetical protein